MAGAEKLIEKILADAQSDADKYLREAEEKKLQMHGELMRDIEKQKSQTEKDAASAAQEKKRRLAAVYDLEYRKQLLAAKQEMMGKAKALAMDKLLAISDADYLALMKKRLLSCAKTGEGSIAVSAGEKRLGSAFLEGVNAELKKTVGKGAVTLSPEKRSITGGFVYTHGGMEINMSLESLLYEAWQESEAEAAKLLFD